MSTSTLAYLKESFEPISNEELSIISVSALSRQIKQQIEMNFSYVKVRGEISGLKKHSSGHIYFSLKDSNQEAILNAICWRGTQTIISLEEGLEIIATGHVTTYPGRSNYQIIVTNAEAAGQGALLKLLQERKQKLAAEGIFNKKQPLPKFPCIIGVITSLTGAVIQDILHRVSDRFPCHVIIWPVAVQGTGSAEQIVIAIKGFNAFQDHKPDVLILARGGGSLEDLWPFNEECVVRAAFESRIPLISAVGHETDTTLIDYVADVRAPTPTAAAELATPVLTQVWDDLESLRRRLTQALYRILETAILRLRNYKLPKFDYILNEKEFRIDDNFERLMRSLTHYSDHHEKTLKSLKKRLLPPQNLINTAEKRIPLVWKGILQLTRMRLECFQNKVENLSNQLSNSSYESILRKGFCLASNASGKAFKNAQELLENTSPDIKLQFYDRDVWLIKKMNGKV